MTGPHSGKSAAGKPGANDTDTTSPVSNAPTCSYMPREVRATCTCRSSESGREGAAMRGAGSRRPSAARAARRRARRYRPCPHADMSDTQRVHSPSSNMRSVTFACRSSDATIGMRAATMSSHALEQFAFAIIDDARPPSHHAGRDTPRRSCVRGHASTISPLIRSNASDVTCAEGLAPAQITGTSVWPAASAARMKPPAGTLTSRSPSTSSPRDISGNPSPRSKFS